MPTTIEDLPFELLSLILTEVISLGSHDASTFVYGLTEAPQPLKAVQLERYVSGQTPPDIVRWQASNLIRRVNRRWHQWALDYSLRELYVRRWRGSERWLEARTLDSLKGRPSRIAVYREPFGSLTSTAGLFTDFPEIASHVRRLWFHGYVGSKTVGYILKVLEPCNRLKSVTLPWTVMRYGKVDDWVKLLERVSSLGLLAVDLKESQMLDPANQVDTRAIQSPEVSFRHLRRLKIFGSTNFRPVCNDDLRCIARTATNLQELHITGTPSVTSEGVMEIVKASKDTLRVLEFSPLSDDGFAHPDPSSWQQEDHVCQALLDCQNLENLSISVPSLCPALFSSETVKWSGELQIRAAMTCDNDEQSMNGGIDHSSLYAILDKARDLMAVRDTQGVHLDVDIFISHWIFEPRLRRVHGNFDDAEAMSDLTWPSAKSPSGKGPYGHTGLYGKEEGPYSSISEEEFAEGLSKGYVTF